MNQSLEQAAGPAAPQGKEKAIREAAMISPAQTPHGRYTTYINHRCRCPECREAWRLYRADFRRRNRKRAGSGIFSPLATSSTARAKEAS